MNLVRVTVILFLVLSFGARAESPWSPDLSSSGGRLTFLRAVLARFPAMLSRNASYPRDPRELLGPVPGLLRALGGEANDTTLGNAEIHGMEFVPPGQVIHDEQRLAAIKRRLLDALPAVARMRRTHLADDLAGLKDGDWKKKVRELLPLVPFLYDASGNAITGDVAQTIRDASPQDLENRYADQMLRHNVKQIEAVAARPGFGQLREWFGTFRNSFVARDLRMACATRYRAGAAGAKRQITLEEVPPLVAVLRGNFGEDCSLHSVPYLPLVKGAKTYWVRKHGDASSPPDGYVVVIPAKIGDRTYPYVVTINGTALDRDDARATATLIARSWGADSVVLPDLVRNPALVNTAEMTEGLKSSRGGAVDVGLPAGMEAVDAHMDAHPSKYRNYYSKTALGRAVLTKVSDIAPVHEAPTHESVIAPYAYGHPTEGSVFRRAVVAAALLKDAAHDVKTETLRHFGLETEDLDKIEGIQGKLRVTPEAYRTLEKSGFVFEDLALLKPLALAASLATLSQHEPTLASDAQWEMLSRIAFRRLANELRANDANISGIKYAESILRLPARGAFDPAGGLQKLLASPGHNLRRAEAVAYVLQTARGDDAGGLRAAARRIETALGAGAETSLLTLIVGQNDYATQNGLHLLASLRISDVPLRAAVTDRVHSRTKHFVEDARRAAAAWGLDAKEQAALMLNGDAAFVASHVLAEAPEDPRTLDRILETFVLPYQTKPAIAELTAVVARDTRAAHDPRVLTRVSAYMMQDASVERWERLNAVDIVAASGTRDPKFLTVLVAALGHHGPLADRALEIITGLALSDAEAKQLVAESRASHEQQYGIGRIMLMGIFADRVPEYMDALHGYARDPDPATSTRALFGLARTTAHGATTKNRLVRDLASGDVRLATRGKFVLDALKISEYERAGMLLDASEHLTDRESDFLVSYAFQHRPDDPRTRPYLEGRWRKPPARASFVRALKELPAMAEVFATLVEADFHTLQTDDRALALEVLVSRRPLSDATALLVLQAMQDPEGSNSVFAAQYLDKFEPALVTRAGAPLNDPQLISALRIVNPLSDELLRRAFEVGRSPELRLEAVRRLLAGTTAPLRSHYRQVLFGNTHWRADRVGRAEEPTPTRVELARALLNDKQHELRKLASEYLQKKTPAGCARGWSRFLPF